MYGQWYARPGFAFDGRDWHVLVDHLQGVADLAASMAQEAIPGNKCLFDLARLSGRLHDLGKFRPGFQAHLRHQQISPEKRYHKQAGALLALNNNHVSAGFAILGHHGGIPNLAELQSVDKSESAKICLEESRVAAEAQVPDWLKIPKAPEIKDRMVGELLTRLVFSLLVDADGADSARFEANLHHWPLRAPAPELKPADLLKTLAGYLQTLASRPMAQETRAARQTVLNACLQAADLKPGLFALRVPTGGGKTLAGLAFALKHAAIHDMRRIIVVAPYLSILEQTAMVIRRALGLEEDSETILEHHSMGDWDAGGSKEQSRSGPRGERWDCPIIITSNIQLLESLFSNKPGRCRKVHQIARSVILLDECQSVPPGLLAPTCDMLNQVAAGWGTTVVMMTATQPAWSDSGLAGPMLKQVREIIPDPLTLYQGMARAQIRWPADKETMSWEEVAASVSKKSQALVILNTRRAAKDLFRELECRETPGLYHLSTALCPAHRRMVLEKCRLALRNNQPCVLVSTQVVEAGVDIDFPAVFREMAPLEAVLQAAGRCNREGLLRKPDGTPAGEVVVFRSREGRLPSDRWYHLGRSVLETVFLASGRPPRIDDPGAIAEYFQHLYASGPLDEHGISDLRFRFQFEDVADKYKLIADDGVSVVVASWEYSKSRVTELIDSIGKKENAHGHRSLIPYQVNMRYSEVQAKGGWITESAPGLLVYRGPYDDSLGLLADDAADQFLLV